MKTVRCRYCGRLWAGDEVECLGCGAMRIDEELAAPRQMRGGSYGAWGGITGFIPFPSRTVVGFRDDADK